ncbi:MAG: SGNH/GDSL hydrolase family protein [Candidatus Hodarchaeota archaeon]
MEYSIDDLRPFIFGLPWLDETWPKLLRMPTRVTKQLSRGIQSLSTNLSGARLRFSSTASQLRFKAKIPRSNPMDHFSRFGQFGVDLYVNGKYWKTLFHKSKIDETIDLYSNERKDFEFYLPIYGALNIQSIITDAPIEDPSRYASDKPILYYGSSITQGGCASRGGMAYPAQLSRRLNLDFVNLGLSGNGFGDLIIAELIAEIDPLIVVLDWGANLIKQGIKTLKERYEEFFRIIRGKHASTPIIMVNIQNLVDETYRVEANEYINTFRKHIKKTYKKIKAEGDDCLWLIDGTEIVGLDQVDATVDGRHASDLGFRLYTDYIEKFLKENKILDNIS